MQTWGLTDPGNIRQQNQDSYAIVPFGRDRVLMIVCDGMGGAKSGNVASSLAVEVFTDEVRRTQRSGMTPEKAAAMLRSALELSNSAVYEQSQLSDDFTGMGTTLVAAWISRDLAVVINVGDSRAYHFTREDVRLITRDHSMVAYMVERGELTQEQAKLHPGKNVITRAVGTVVALATVLRLAQLEALDHGTHGTVQNDDALGQRGRQFLGARVGDGGGGGVRRTHSLPL